MFVRSVFSICLSVSQIEFSLPYAGAQLPSSALKSFVKDDAAMECALTTQIRQIIKISIVALMHNTNGLIHKLVAFSCFVVSKCKITLFQLKTH